MQEGKEIVIAYASRALTVHEKKFSTIEREMLALVYGLKRFRHYLYGNEILIYSDHHPLVWLQFFEVNTMGVTITRIQCYYTLQSREKEYKCRRIIKNST